MFSVLAGPPHRVGVPGLLFPPAMPLILCAIVA